MGHNKNNELHEIKWANYGSFYNCGMTCKVTLIDAELPLFDRKIAVSASERISNFRFMCCGASHSS